MVFSSAAYGGEIPLPTLIIRLTIFLLSLAALWKFRRFYPVWPAIDLPAMLFLLYMLLSTGWAVYPWAAYQFAMNILAVALVYLLLRLEGINGDGEKEAERILATVMIAGTAQVAWELFQFFSGQSARPGGAFTNPNYLAGYLFFGVVASIHFGTRKAPGAHPAKRWPFLALAALMGYGIFLTRSRAMVAVAAGVFLFLILCFRGRRMLRVAGACGGVGLLLAAGAARFSTAADPYALGRIQIWKAAWKTALAHPFGVGLGGYKFYWFRYRDPIENAAFRYGRTADTAHSQFFGILSELGFPGIILALAVAVSVLVLMLRESRRDDRILPLCLIPLGAMIHAFLDVNLDLFAIALPVAACTALLAARNVRPRGEGALLFPALRAGLALILVPCIAYSVAGYAGLSRYHRGLESLKGDRTEQAMNDFSSARGFDPLNSAYPDAISSVYYRWFLSTRGVEYLAAGIDAEQQAVAASPENPLHLSQAGFLLGELAEATAPGESRNMYRGFALSALGESLRKDPHSIVALIRTAEVFRRNGEPRKARAALERLIASEPNAVRGYLLLAQIEEEEDPAAAAAHYRKAIALSVEFEGKQLEKWEKEMFRVDRREIERRIETIETVH